jgi:hypothetical protein
MHDVSDRLAVELGEVTGREGLGCQDLVDSIEQFIVLLLSQEDTASHCVEQNPDVHPGPPERVALIV